MYVALSALGAHRPSLRVCVRKEGGGGHDKETDTYCLHTFSKSYHMMNMHVKVPCFKRRKKKKKGDLCSNTVGQQK